MEVLRSVALKKGNLSANSMITKESVIIIDLYNIYCNLISFNKYKTFSIETFEICIEKILKGLKQYHVVFISKNIYEVPESEIRVILDRYKNKYYNIMYIIVEDLHHIKSLNKERDDYVCLLLSSHLKNKKINTFILSNDRFKNYDKIISDVKPLNIKYIYNNFPSELISDLKFDLQPRKNFCQVGFNFSQAENSISSCRC